MTNENTEESKSQEVALAEAENKALAVQSDEINFEEDAGQGAENITASMLVIPFISIIQSTSGYVKKTEPSYLKGAEEGFIINTASKKMWDGDSKKDGTGVNMVVSIIKPKHVEWVPREKGGGLVKIWEDDSYKTMKGYVKAEKGLKIVTPEGNEIIEYLDLYCILQDPASGEFMKALFSAKSTSIKPTRQLLTQLTSQKLPSTKKPGAFFQPPMFYNAVRMTTVGQSNNQGSWYSPKFELLGPTTEKLQFGKEIYREARDFYDDIKANKVQVDEKQREKTGEVADEEVPF